MQIFYVISGFLISFVLTEARHYQSVSGFYLNRILRLCPIYWVVALGTLAMLILAETIFGISTPTFDVFREIGLTGKLALAFSNVFIFGQDWIMFTGVEDRILRFSADYTQSDIPVWRGLLVPPAWTLGVELSFYVIAPFVLFRPKLIIGLLVASIALRGLLVAFGPGLQDPWTYRFFPTELALFFAGALSHQYWMPWLRQSGRLSNKAGILVTMLVAAGCVGFDFLPFRQVSWVLFLVLVALALPFLFQFQRRFGWDRKIGELSYPIYVAHWSVLYPVSYFWNRALGVEWYVGGDETLVVLALTVTVALLLNRYVADRVEVVRRSVKRRGQKPTEETVFKGAPFYGASVRER